MHPWTNIYDHPQKLWKIYRLQSLNYENQIYEKLIYDSFEFKLRRNFNSFFICILALMLNFKIYI